VFLKQQQVLALQWDYGFIKEELVQVVVYVNMFVFVAIKAIKCLFANLAKHKARL
jgi:hypothetical protein